MADAAGEEAGEEDEDEAKGRAPLNMAWSAEAIRLGSAALAGDAFPRYFGPWQLKATWAASSSPRNPATVVCDSTRSASARVESIER